MEDRQHDSLGVAEGDFVGECLGETFQPTGLERQAGRHRVAPETFNQPRLAVGDRLQRVTHVHARNRAGRSLEASAVVGSKGDHRAMHALLQAPGEDAHDALVPPRVEQAERRGQVAIDGQVGDHRLGLDAHAMLDLAPFGDHRPTEEIYSTF